MIHMMMWTPQDGDRTFIETMHDFVSTYRLQPATTEDFKSIVEKHMTPAMDLDNNHTMNWFFDEYVYGTDLPAYHFESDILPNGDGSKVHFKLVQSGVGNNFRNLVPIYVELADGRILRLGAVRIHGNNSIDQSVQLPKLSAPIRKVTINYNYDVLCTDN